MDCEQIAELLFDLVVLFGGVSLALFLGLVGEILAPRSGIDLRRSKHDQEASM